MHLHACVSLSVCVRTRAAPSILCERGGHPERQQPDHRVYRRQDVLLESGHALPAAGTEPSHRLAQCSHTWILFSH